MKKSESFYKEFGQLTGSLHCLTKVDHENETATSYYQTQRSITISERGYNQFRNETNKTIVETSEENYYSLMKNMNFQI